MKLDDSQNRQALPDASANGVPDAAPVSNRPRGFFRPADTSSRLSKDASAREGQIVRFAIAELGGQGAQSFLNGIDDGLRGRPLAIATTSAEGARVVREAILAKAASLRMQRRSIL